MGEVMAERGELVLDVVLSKAGRTWLRQVESQPEVVARELAELRRLAESVPEVVVVTRRRNPDQERRALATRSPR